MCASYQMCAKCSERSRDVYYSLISVARVGEALPFQFSARTTIKNGHHHHGVCGARGVSWRGRIYARSDRRPDFHSVSDLLLLQRPSEPYMHPVVQLRLFVNGLKHARSLPSPDMYLCARRRRCAVRSNPEGALSAARSSSS